MSTPIKAEDVMTPRQLLQFRADEAAADRLAQSAGFDAVPISRSDGQVRSFWSRVEKRLVRIGRAHRTAHDAPVERLLPRLGEHVVQFVYYRSELVGLVNASDLNRPLARIAWLQPMLELERAILDTVRTLGISDDEQAAVLGTSARQVRQRQKAAARADLELPLLEYADFLHLLNAARQLGVTDLTESTLKELNHIRRRAAHSGDVVVESRSDCAKLEALLVTVRACSLAAYRMRRRRQSV